MSSQPIVESGSHNRACHDHCECDCDLYHVRGTNSQPATQQQFDTDACVSSRQGSRSSAGSNALAESLIRGNMQYVNGQLKKIPRPLNAFMIFSNERRKELKKQYPGEPNNLISSRLGAAWKALGDEDRKKYHDMAHREDLEHRRKYPNYQYCPGHARKLKKARKEQRKRQQQSSCKTVKSGQRQTRLRSAATVTGSPSAGDLPDCEKDSELGVKNERGTPSDQTYSPNHTPARSDHSLAKPGYATSSLPGPHGEGHHIVPNPFIVSHPPDMAADCSMACCAACKPSDCSYCCPDSAWNMEMLAGHGYPPAAAVQPHMMYFAAGPCDPQCAMEMMPGQCIMPGECTDCYPGGGLMEACFQPPMPYPLFATGEGPALPSYKEFCCGSGGTELAMGKPNNLATPVLADNEMNDSPMDLTDISNNNLVQSSSLEEHCSYQGKPTMSSITAATSAAAVACASQNSSPGPAETDGC